MDSDATDGEAGGAISFSTADVPWFTGVGGVVCAKAATEPIRDAATTAGISFCMIILQLVG
jgi:hypothetical protein